ncbi:MAG: hypothetical protein Q9226_005650, partial [Calogaya cf. arnoldii]
TIPTHIHTRLPIPASPRVTINIPPDIRSTYPSIRWEPPMTAHERRVTVAHVSMLDHFSRPRMLGYLARTAPISETVAVG